MNLRAQRRVIALIVLSAAAPLIGAEVRVDLGREQVGRLPTTFEPMVGTWVVAQDGPDK